MKTNKQTENTKYIPSSNAIQFQLVVQDPVLLSHQKKKKIKRESEAVAHLPPTLSHLLLQALFIYRSPGCMPLLFSLVYISTHLLQLQSVF
jgi:hypothetical protein